MTRLPSLSGEMENVRDQSREANSFPTSGWNEKHTHWPATAQRGSRAKGGGQVEPQMCVCVRVCVLLVFFVHCNTVMFFLQCWLLVYDLRPLTRHVCLSLELHKYRTGKVSPICEIDCWAFPEIIYWIDSSFHWDYFNICNTDKLRSQLGFWKGAHRNTQSWMVSANNCHSITWRRHSVSQSCLPPPPFLCFFLQLSSSSPLPSSLPPHWPLPVSDPPFLL